MMRRLCAWAVLCMAVCMAPAWAQVKEAQPLVANQALEKKVLAIADELRCLVCQNETLAASQAELAVDLRRQIARMLEQGQSRQQVIDFMVARYGDFVLYRPPLGGRTLLLWFGPFVLLVAAVVGMLLHIRKRRQLVAGAATWTPEQEQRARRLLDEEEGAGPTAL